LFTPADPSEFWRVCRGPFFLKGGPGGDPFDSRKKKKKSPLGQVFGAKIPMSVSAPGFGGGIFSEPGPPQLAFAFHRKNKNAPPPGAGARAAKSLPGGPPGLLFLGGGPFLARGGLASVFTFPAPKPPGPRKGGTFFFFFSGTKKRRGSRFPGDFEKATDFFGPTHFGGGPAAGATAAPTCASVFNLFRGRAAGFGTNPWPSHKTTGKKGPRIFVPGRGEGPKPPPFLPPT